MKDMPWTKKYQPKTASEVVGHQKQLDYIKSFILNYKKQKKKALIIYGPPGVGKTSSVHAIANDLGHEIFELNASDFRNRDNIENILGSAINQRSLFFSDKVILVDEIEGIGGREDFGGIAALKKLLEKSTFPVVMTAANPWEQKLSPLRQKSELLELKPPGYLDILHVLKNICENEGIKYDDQSLKTLARRSGGDIRSAVNDLESISVKKEITSESVDSLSDRNRVESMLNALVKIFKSNDINIAIDAFSNVDEDFDKQFLWIDENIPVEYKKPEDLSRAYDSLSRADVFMGRIRRRQHWRFLVYVNAMLSAGIACAKHEKYPGFTAYKPTGRILKLWRAKMKYQKRKGIAQKIAQKTHTSSSRALHDTLPFVKNMAKNGNKEIAEWLELDREEHDWLRK